MSLRQPLSATLRLNAINNLHGSLQRDAAIAATGDPHGVFREAALQHVRELREELDALVEAIEPGLETQTRDFHQRLDGIVEAMRPRVGGKDVA